MCIKEYHNENSDYAMPNGGEFIGPFKKINIFVGANNSGKSRFMRQMLKAGVDRFVFFDDVNTVLMDIYSDLYPTLKDYFYMEGLHRLANSRTGDYISRFNEFIDQITAIKTRSGGLGTPTVWDYDVAQAIRLQMILKGVFKKFESEEEVSYKKVYIPILRGLRHVDLVNKTESKDDIYSNRTVDDYKIPHDTDDISVFSGLAMYSEFKKMLLGSKRDREFVRDFERFIATSFFDGKSITLIPDHDTDNIKLNINDGEHDREIYNIGDGIQSVLINTFQAFKYKDQRMVLFIEEPEMMMHPSVQRILIETLVNKFDNLQVFLTTHSNHFLDLTYDYPDSVTIFSFKEKGKEKFEISDIADHVKIIDLLGIRNSSVFLSNCVIWTEGVTDRIILRKLISLDPSFKYIEDRQYAFAEYGGGNLENFDFSTIKSDVGVRVSAISRTNYIIIDSDGESEGSRFERRQNIKSVIGRESVFDEHIEIENLIPYKVWIEVIRKILADYPQKEIRFKENFEEIRDIEKDFNMALTSKKIGEAIKMIVEVKDGVDIKYFIKNDIKCLGLPKKEIAEYIITVIDHLDINLSDFPDSAQALICNLKDFIKRANESKF